MAQFFGEWRNPRGTVEDFVTTKEQKEEIPASFLCYSNSACQFLADIVILNCMTRPFSLRARPSLLAAIDARAARLGQDRTKYILSLVEQDLTEDKKPRPHKFASYDLIGSVSTGIGFGDNATIRKIIRQRLKERSEKNR